MEQLAELQSDGYIQYWGQEDLLLIELRQDSELLDTLTDEQIEVGEYVRRKQRQIDQVIFYAFRGYVPNACDSEILRRRCCGRLSVRDVRSVPK